MSRKKVYIEKLTEIEVSNLESGYKYGKSPDFRSRCHMILLSHRRFEVKQIRRIVAVCAQTVYGTMKNWRQHGIVGLIRRPGQGRKPYLRQDNAEHVEAVQDAVENHAQSSATMLEQVKAELGIAKMNKRTLRRFLKKWATPGSVCADG
jgi:transposase